MQKINNKYGRKRFGCGLATALILPKKDCQDFDRTPGIFALQFVVLKDLKGHTCTNQNVLIDSFAPRLTVLLSQTTVAFRQFSTHAPHWKANAGQPNRNHSFVDGACLRMATSSKGTQRSCNCWFQWWTPTCDS